jgi:Ca2+-binding EF-hand superfamily protein
MMGQGMPGMMGQGMMQPGMMGGMHGHMMKIMFAIADSDGDGGLSFEEVTTIHKRIFDKVDANKDGKVTPEEAQAFMQE